MSYKDLLKEYVQNSGMSHREISRKCKELGKPVSQAYISQLIKGDVPPPSEEVSRILAEVTNGDPDKLITTGYIEKSPLEVQNLIKHYVDRLDLYTHMVASFFSDVELPDDHDEQDKERFMNEIKNIGETINKIPIEERIDFVVNRFNRVVYSQPEFMREIGENTGVSEETIDYTIKAIKEKPLNRIEVWDLDKDQKYHEWVPIEKIRFGEYIYVVPRDDSMKASNINKGAKVLCRLHEGEPIESGKIYLVLYEDNFYVRRVFVNDNQPITLQAENIQFPPIIIQDEDDLEIIGIVESVEFNPNE